MSGEASSALQTAIYGALSSDPRLTTVVGASGVHDWAGPSVSFPCISIGGDTAVEWSGCTFDGQESTVMVHTWSQSSGRKEVKTLMGHVYRILHRANLNISGQQLVSMFFEYSSTDLDPDGATFHGVQRFRAITQGV